MVMVCFAKSRIKMKKKVYNENDEIELRLTHNVADHYWLEWRFKEPGRFLFFKKYDKWKSIRYYCPGIYTADEDPDRDFNWYWRGFHLGNKHEVQEYEHLKEIIHTKKELYKYYNVQGNIDKYYRDKEAHQKWLEEYNDAVNRLTK